MELRHLRYFVAVAEELNFRRAAQRLRVAQPPLSTQVRQLEEEIGARLLERDSHRVALTAAGAAFLEHGRRILHDAEEAAHAARRAARGETGRLSIGFVASLAQGVLPGVLRDYRKQFPAVELSLKEMDTAQQMEELAARRLDLGFIGLGLPQESSELELAVVAEEPLVAALPEDHPLARDPRRKSVQLSALSKEKFFLAARQNAPVYNPWLMVLCQQAGFQPQVAREADRPATALNYVAAGFGVTIVPAQFGRTPTPGVRFLTLSGSVPRYRYCAAWRRDAGTPALGRFIVAAREAAARMKGEGGRGNGRTRAGGASGPK